MKKRLNRIRLIDIAEKTHLSVNTISKVLNGREKEAGIAVETAKRVRKMADELGYIPDQMARCLRAKNTDTIGVYIDKITDHVRAETLHAILQELSNRGLFPLIMLAEAGYEKCCEAFIRNRIEGLILCGTMQAMNADFFNRLYENKIKTVITGCFFHDRNLNNVFREVSFVNVDNERGVELQIRHLHEQGRSRIAFLSGPTHDSDMHIRKKTYMDLIKTVHEPVVGQIDKDTSYLEHGYWSMDMLLAGRQEIDAVIAFDDKVALGAIRCLHDKGRNVPGDVAVIGFDNSPEDDYTLPRLSSISLPTQEIGTKSVELLLDRLENKTKPKTIYVLPSLVARESTQPSAGKPQKGNPPD
ncbi:MAG: LacI family DNA-binding transcriptional regulator [Sedimentisphaerales bacterium]|nr:LacI family DNA-binding transcriptional regulator [Sedimentisphaerales bacterium]